MSDAVRAPGASRALDFIETSAVALAIYVAFMAGGLLTFALSAAVHSVLSTGSSDELVDETYWRAAGWLASFCSVLFVIWLAVRRAGWRLSDYLALTWPSGSELVVALSVMFAVLHISAYIRVWFSAAADICIVPDDQSARSSIALFLFLATSCVVAPITEEFAARGFLFRGWSESFLGPAGAVALTSALWAAGHTQYGWPGRFEIFLDGLALGYFRYRSGSTLLAVVVHSAINLYLLVLLGQALRPV